MKIRIGICFLILIVTVPTALYGAYALIGIISNYPVYPFSELYSTRSSYGINWQALHQSDDLYATAGKEVAAAEKSLADLYTQILDKYRDNQVFITALSQSQAAWLQFRDAHMEALYPEDDKLAYYGSIYRLCAPLHLAELTWARVAQLALWLNEPGNEQKEGVVCAGIQSI